MFPLCGVPLADDERRRLARLFQAPLAHIGARSLKQAAGEAERDPRLLKRWLELEEGALLAVAKQGTEYLRWLAVEIAADLGLPKQARRAMLLRRVSVTRKVQARIVAQARKDKVSA